MAEHGSDAAFAYHEPPITTLLNQTGFLVVLNLVNVCLDKILYCGLIGQLFVGILWGTPGAKWLDRETETVIQQLGYLGLIMLVYEGGLSTSIKSVRANLVVSLCVAITGIGAPMGLSFILNELVGATSLQAFAAGAALSATSLGTTFTILSTTNLISTRLGTVTTSAAMLDDVVGLVMVQIISNLGGSASSFSSLTVIRPVFVSIGFAVGLLLLCAFFIKPMLKKIISAKPKVPNFMRSMEFAFLYQTVFLVGLVAGATYAGTSSLFAAYLAGVIVTWFDGIITESNMPPGDAPSGTPPTDPNSSHVGAQDNGTLRLNGQSEISIATSTSAQRGETPTGEKVYEKYYKQPVIRILTPLFFASIGFAIPITEMFKGSVVWRGVIYALLMMFGKLITGIWLVRFSSHPLSSLANVLKSPLSRIHLFCIPTRTDKEQKENRHSPSRAPIQSSKVCASNNQANTQNQAVENCRSSEDKSSAGPPKPQEDSHATPRRSSKEKFPPKPKSLYPPSILGLAMVARGEVGYLIASLAQSQGMFGTGSSGEISEIYLVIIWAISICTLVGPICVGTLVKRVKKLQEIRGDSSPDPLGVWGV
ncbi:Sodium/hydrogen exchanger family-domain-containing protein [Penicillium brevicompactum]|uniref:Sodium/hydrogen exchanger family-domain-containing protein n=1 Tax=Penicillium brevicompactum TaxID=5074 RepID=UPI0025419F6C|nr:Sodium/hydrogen exchanger family-domain-containing protein [Penicillium brevicompactum]KAJ5346924.1 Sodium/hydrogen exchanger family-domain-containing protein [Penicillium brevicompactum]